jgi:Glycosyltransferase
MLNKDLKILQLGKFYPIKGGVEKVAYELMLGVSSRGIRCDMSCAASRGNGKIHIINDHASLITTKSLTKLASTMISPNMIFALKKFCDRYNIIHVHHPDPMACVALFLSGYKGRVILHWHSDIIKQRVLLNFYRPLQSWLIKRADIIIGTTPTYLEESPFLKGYKEKLRCIPIGIDPVNVDEYSSRQLRKKYGNKKIVFSLGRLVEYKGYEYLIESAKYLPEDYIILIGGTGPLKESLEEKIRVNNLSSKVEMIGRIEDSDLSKYYAGCDIFCLPSIYKTEAFGIVQIEAMSCGKPIVATSIPHSGVPWVNKNNISGINVMPRSSKELADAIIKITSNTSVYNKYSIGAKERFNALFRKEKMIESCLEVYVDTI